MRTIAISSILMLLIMTSAAHASFIVTENYWEGSRSFSGGGIIADGSWNTDSTGKKKDAGFQISWDIDRLQSGLYSYTYTLSGENGASLSKGISHWILEVEKSITGLGMPGSYSNSQGRSNPHMPNTGIFGIKFELDDKKIDTNYYTLSFLTEWQPVWGDFYAKSGNGGNSSPTYAYNAGFGTSPTSTTTNFNGWVATPGHTTSAVPIPGAVWLLGAGLVGLVSFRKKATA